MEKDIPRDTSGLNQPGFRLPLLPSEVEVDEYDDVEIIEADQPRSLDTSGPDSSPVFKLPTDEVELDDYFDVEIIEAPSDDDEPRSLDIPRDTSGPDSPGFKLPLPGFEFPEVDEYDDVVVIQADDVRLPKKLDDDAAVIIEVGDDDFEVDCFAESEVGHCLNSFTAYFYDANHNKCHFFLYSGCGGNTNR